MAAFIVVIIAIVASAAVEYPEIAGSATSEGAIGWPPRFPVFGEFTPDLGPIPECDAVVLCLNIVGYFALAVLGFLVDILFFIGGVIAFIFTLFAGMAAFAVSGFPPQLVWVGTGIAIIFIIVLAIIFIRLVISMIPLAGGG